MRYVFVGYDYIPDFNSPGSWLNRIKMYTSLLKYLSDTNAVFHISQIDYEGYLFIHGVHHHFVKFSKRETRFPLQLNRFIKSLNPDVIVLQGLHRPLQLIQLGLLLSKRARIVAQHHAERPFTGIKKHIQRFAGRFVDGYLFASKAMGLEWVKCGNIASAGKIHELMEVSSSFYPMGKETARSSTGATGNPVFLWVGRLNANKDPLTVVNAFLKYVRDDPSARLYMIYHTDELLDEIKLLLTNEKGKNTVVLVGKVPHDELLYWFNSADFMISGSHYEGSGTAVCEAMSCGCVPIVTDIPSFRMMTNNGKCGLLYEAGSKAALWATLMKARHLDMVEERDKALMYFQTNLSFEAIARGIEEIACTLCN